MDIFGIGISELIFIALIALVILGPKDMQKAGRAIGDGLRKLFTSDTWRMLVTTSRELQTLPQKLAREANLRQAEQELQNEAGKIGDAIDVKSKVKIETESPILPSPEPPLIPYPPSNSSKDDQGKD